MKFSVSPHLHVESPLTGSTIADMLARAKALGRTHVFFADHGHMSSALRVSYVLKEEEKRLKTKFGLKVIPGIEIYFKDMACPIVAGTIADKCKYFSATIYCEDQESYQELCKIVSRTDFATIEIYEEKQQLWNWSDLERIAKLNVHLILGSVHCMVGKVMLAKKPDLAELVLTHLKSLFKDRLYISLVCEPWSKKYSQVIEIKYSDGTKSTCLSTDLVTTDRARRIKALDLIDNARHNVIKAVYSSNTFSEVNKVIASTKLHKGFLPFPGGDALHKINKFLYIMAKKHDIKVLVSDYAYYANRGDKIVQTMRLEGNNKLFPSLHMKSTEEISDYLKNVLGLQKNCIDEIIENNDKWAARFNNFSLKYDWRLPDSGGDPLKKAMEIIKKNGRMKWDNPVCVSRLKEELSVISKNGIKDLTGYFLPICDVMTVYKENGKLTGPARGSAAGSYLCYLLGITQVDSIKRDLSFPRFLSLDRIKNGDFPDVDSDFGDRSLLVGEDGCSGYLYNRWGTKAAQISTRHTIRLKSAIKDVNRSLNGSVEREIEIFSKSLPDPPQGVSDQQFVFGYEDTDGNHQPGIIEIDEDLKKYAEKRPKEWGIVQKSLGITRAFSQHASAFIISDIPISDVMPTKLGHITQYEAKAVESCRLLKYDFLVVSNIKDIEVCLKLINKKNNENQTIGYFTHNDKLEYIWDLPENIEVFKDIWNGRTETLFQINTKAMIPFVQQILPKSVEDLSTILALVRPGPMDFIDDETGRSMAEEYVWRRQKRSEPNLKELYDLIPETEGVIVYQEQSLKISKELGGMLPTDAEKLRRLFSKKLKVEAGEMKPIFMSTAIPKIGEEKANKIWDMMETSSRYSFNRSHSLSYAMITYAGMFLRYHYPLEWWAAVLTNATEQEITGKFWPFVKDMVSPPDINLSGDTMAVDYANEKIRAKLGIIRGMGEATIEPLVSNRPYKDIQDFVNKDVCGPSLANKLTLVGVLDSLYPPKSTLVEKFKMYADAVELKKFNDKIEKAKKEGKTIRVSQPKEGKLPEEYLNLSLFVDASLKKSILPSMPLDLHGLGKKYSKIIIPYTEVPKVMSPNGHPTKLIDGERLRRLDELDGQSMEKDIYVASTCFIIKAEEFSYSKGAKRALKITIDSDGYVSEKVLWPDFNTGVLSYPKELKKGCIATIFFRKKVNKKDTSVQSIYIEA